MSCPRLFTKDQIISGLKSGRSIIVDRKDAPELDDLLELHKQGLIDFKIIEVDDQSTIAKFWWKNERVN